MVRGVSVDAPFHSARRHPQRPTARGRLDRLEVPVVDHRVAYQRFDFGDDLGCERRFAPPPFGRLLRGRLIRDPQLGVTYALAGFDQLLPQRAELVVLLNLLACPGHRLGRDNLGDRLAFHRMGQRETRPVAGLPLPRAMTVGLAASAIAFHQRPWAQVSDLRQRGPQRVAALPELPDRVVSDWPWGPPS